jgi:tRNA U34 5-methylaminomethyl-2-thiouridine-forming methyltransferase MnmC
MEEWDEYYHSMHGAYNEAVHVYIQSGLNFWNSNYNLDNTKCRIFEMGFGTGLNTLLSLESANEQNLNIQYETIEPFPLEYQEIKDLNFEPFFNQKKSEALFKKLHLAPWEQTSQINEHFNILKKKTTLSDFNPQTNYDLIYYDAFGSRVQPEMWSEEALLPLIESLAYQGVFVTYSAKGSVRRILESFGLNVFRIQGPPGKREMLRAIRL